MTASNRGIENASQPPDLPPSGPSFAHAAKTTVLERTQRRIELFSQAGDDWRFAESLKSISEDTAQEYAGRAVLELVQNGHDALHPDQPGRITVLVDLQAEQSVLYVANEGASFTEGNFRSITEFALSDKGPGEGIGNKGLGFRSVLQLTDWPEVYSKANTSSAAFDGYCFRFATPDDLSAIVDDAGLAARVAEQVSPLALPVPAQPVDPVLAEFAEAGFVTVMRLPLRNAVAAAAAISQAKALAANEAPLLLFLDRIAALTVEVRDGEGRAKRHVLTRSEGRSDLVAEQTHDWVSEVDLGAAGRYLLARRLLPVDELNDAIERSVEAREIDDRWRSWSGEAWVGVGLRLDAEMRYGRLYTFLPMSEGAKAPLCAHAHAPFFTKLARLDLSESVALNDYLLGQLATLSMNLSRRLRVEAPHDVAARLVLDLVCWDPPGRLNDAFGSQLGQEPIVPLGGGTRWGTLEESYTWANEPRPWGALTTDALAQVGVKLLDPSVGHSRSKRTVDLHQALFKTPMRPPLEVVADWAERVAARMRPASETEAFRAWADFYDDLEQAFRHKPDALHGRKIILDRDGDLRPALGGPSQPGQHDRTIFLSPAEDDDAVSRVPHDLRALRRRISFTHPQIPWRRPGRGFLESHQLVREYRTDRVFDAIKDLLAATTSDPLRRDALNFAFGQFVTLNKTQRTNLARIGFFVPKADGTWAKASESLFSPAWGTEGALRLEQFLAEGGSAVPPLAALPQRWITSPDQWPAQVRDTEAYREFLRSIGVRDGLLLFNLGTRLSERNGVDLKPRALAQQFHLDDRLAQSWAADVEANWSGGAHPWTTYTFSQQLVYLPGAPAVETLSAPARRQFAELILLGLRSWGDHVFSVTVRRPGRPLSQQDPHIWPTPFASYLRHLPWLPVEDSESGSLTFVPPSQAWFSRDSELPAFIPGIPLSIRRLLAQDQPLARLRQAGLRIWEDPHQSGAVVKELGSILAEDAVSEHLSISFKRHYARAWTDAARLSAWPWTVGEPVRLAVDYGATLTAITASGQQEVYVTDEAAPLKESLVALAGHPVLITESDAGEAVAQMLEANGIGVARLSETEVKVLDGETLIVASSDHPLLTEGKAWLTTVVALVLELKSGAFIRRSERGIRALLDRLRGTRIARAGEVEILLDRVRAEPSKTTRSLPLPDLHHPTVVVWNSDGVWDELQACAPALSQLLGQPSLQDALELAFVKLHRILGDDPINHIDDQTLASALDTTESRVGELRRGLTGELTDLVHLLRPVLICASGVGDLDAIDQALARANSENVLREAISTWGSSLPHDVSEIIVSARRCRSLAEFRDDLGLDFGQFNVVLSVLGPPYTPIVYPDAHDQIFDEYVRAHAPVVLDRLREHYSPLAARGEDVSGYTDARRLDGLVPDPAWLLEFRVPPQHEMRATVGAWLRQHGAQDDLVRPSALEPVERTRAWNATRLDSLVPTLLSLISAWCRLRGAVVPAGWAGSPLTDVKAALHHSGLSDLLRLDEPRLLNVVADSVGWPLGMPRTANTDVLGLASGDLVVRNVQTPGGSVNSPDRSTINVGNTMIMVGNAHLAEIADLASQTVDEAFLSQPGTVLLNEQSGDRTQRPPGSQTPRTVAVRMARMSEDQRSAVGLIGEVIARAWLARRYGEVRWRSGYAAILNADPDASDGHGYDFEIPWRNTSLLYEVKALTNLPGELIEFEMGESEVRAAQERANSNRYRILLITSVLDPSSRRIYELPSPFSAKGRGRFRVAGRGLRYECGPLESG
ncbi:hypothetical protein OG589_27430 [Sphaerisporangium sp. NBC_01403]|uniref:sacsin N-terminal ATP-binding-like domain-containing protein n=1 Tax=Sphaerisporangium sp. NBC_01403 TaxID=2903599 RepID=UPI00324B3714